jgi:sulfoxide reductase catalytic subunit YedY
MAEQSDRPPASEITPPSVYFNRRTFIKAGAIAATAAATGGVYRLLNGLPPPTKEKAKLAGLVSAGNAAAGDHVDPAIARAFTTDEARTSFQSITGYNNYYEFSTDKDGVAAKVGHFSTAGWKIAVDGLVAKPTTFDLDDLAKISRPEERVYRMRCVETWSMVIPWAGFSLSKLLARVRVIRVHVGVEPVLGRALQVPCGRRLLGDEADLDDRLDPLEAVLPGHDDPHRGPVLHGQLPAVEAGGE